MTVEVTIKAFWYAPVLLVVGVSATFWLVLPRVGPRESDGLAAAEALLRRVGVATSIVAVVAVVARAWAHTAAVFGLTESLTWSALSTVVIASRWGQSWRWQMFAALTCVVTFGAEGGGRRAVWLAAGCASVGLAAAVTMTGHAGGAPDRMALHTAHVLAGGMWLGALATLMIIRHRVDERRRALFATFSIVAVAAASLLVVTGIAASYLYVGSFSNLWRAMYGRVLLLKVTLVVGALLCGALNRQSIHRGRREPGLAGTIELAVACAIVAATSLLTELEHP